MLIAAFIAHCPYEIGDKVEVTMIDGMAVSGYPSRIKSGEMTITDILTLHSLRSGTVNFICELDNRKKVELIPWNELVKNNAK